LRIKIHSLGYDPESDNGEPIPTDLAAQEGLVEELEAIVAWQREVDALSRDLATHLGDLARQQELLEALIKIPA